MPRGKFSIPGRRRVWTTEETFVVHDMLEQGADVATIARRLGRSYQSVKVYCSRNVKVREVRQMSARAVARVLGVPDSGTVGTWLERGYLRGARGQVRSGGVRRWVVSDEALLEFLEAPEHWHRWHPEAITDEALREWALERRTERFLTQAEVARRYHVITKTVGAWMDRGQLPYVDTGSHRMVRESDLSGFVMPGLRDRHGVTPRPFTAVEDAQLLALRAEGLPWRAIADRLGRAMGSCANRHELIASRRTAVAA